MSDKVHSGLCNAGGNMLVCVFYLSLVLSFIFADFSGEDFFQGKSCWTFKGSHLEECEHTLMFSFNKQNMVEFNSTRGNWIGFTKGSKEAAKILNDDPYEKSQRLFELTMCEKLVNSIQYIGNLTTPPTMKLNLVKLSDGEHRAKFICSAYDFYPKQIQLTWLRNGQEVTEGVSYSSLMYDGDSQYQFHSRLKYFPTSGERITCMVEHFSLSEPKLVDWDDSLLPEDMTPIVFGLCVLMVGLIVLSSGFIYYKKHQPHTTPATEMLARPEDLLPGKPSVTE
uniref:Ig-like domain-containing protein n=2 Tax=Nothobranchius TaxID=28779 RepID=A0A1A8NCZ3_9TELE